MARPLPDPTLYPSPLLAMEAPPETLAYVALLAAEGRGRTDALGVVDTDPASPGYGRLVGRVDLPHAGNELRHLGWNACSSHLGARGRDGTRAAVERRYLVVPGAHSSRIHVVDTKPDARRPRLVKVIEGDEVRARTGYAAPHGVRCGPDGIYVNALGAPDGDGPGGIFVLDRDTFALRGAWERDRGPQYLAYDFAWHVGHDTLVTSEWGTPNMVTEGIDAEQLLAGRYGHALHVWDVRTRQHMQAIELGAEQQMVLELRAAHNPTRAWGFAGVVMSLDDLSSSVFLWYLDGAARGGRGEWKARRVITIPAEPTRAASAPMPPLLQGFRAVPPLVTGISLSVDDRWLYVSCWGTGELRQYDVSDPFNPVLTGSLRIGGIGARAAHPGAPGTPRDGGPQAVAVSRDGRRVYLTNSLYSPWDAQLYPQGIGGWMARVDVGRHGGMAFDPRFLVEFEAGFTPRQVRLEGGDASSDAFCNP